jgi:divalent metal cation (Fe/Co/Zn/Cd) transporter
MQPSDLQNISWSFIVLVVSILIEGKSFHVAYSTFSKTKGKSGMVKALRDSTDTNLFVILLEDSAALIGLTIVLVSTALAWFVHPVFDAIGSVMVGILLISISLFMINELRKLIVGENISPELRKVFSDKVLSYPSIHRVNSVSAMMIGKSRFLLVIGVDLEDNLLASVVEDQFDKIRKELMGMNPDIHSIYFDVRDMGRESGDIKMQRLEDGRV